LSVIFKYIKNIKNINLNIELLNFYKQENVFLKEKINKLQNALQDQLNTNKQLQNEIVVNKINLKIIKPSILLLIIIIFLSIGAIGGIYFASKNSVENILTKYLVIEKDE